MTTTVTSFTSLLGDIIHRKGSGAIYYSNCCWIPSVYCLRLLHLKVLLSVLSAMVIVVSEGVVVVAFDESLFSSMLSEAFVVAKVIVVSLLGGGFGI